MRLLFSRQTNTLCTVLGLTFALLLAPSVSSAAVNAQSERTLANSDPDEAPRQVILLIGDGMGEQQISIARNYLEGSSGRLGMDALPLRSSVAVLTVEDKVDGKPVYVADSANTATAIATGVVTSRGRIATSPGDDRDLRTIVEMAADAGLRTGIVSTASVTDATPAAFAAHVNLRLCENPEMMVDITIRDVPLGGCPQDLRSAGGAGSISEQLVNGPLDVILGGGAKHFSPTAEGHTQSVEAIARQHGFTVLSTKDELAAAGKAATGDGAAQQRLLGLFAPSTLPVRLKAASGRTAEAPQPSVLNRVHRYLGSVEIPPETQCEPDPSFAPIPTLAHMTEVAIAQLSAQNDKGFFLMIESASIDKQAHMRQPCGSIGELEQLDEALAVAMAFAQTHPRTLILVTADHSQAAQIIPSESLFAAYPIPLYSPGKIARLATLEGGHMTVNYATTNFMLEEHTGAAVPLLSNSEGQGRIPAHVTQPEIFGIVKDYLGL